MTQQVRVSSNKPERGPAGLVFNIDVGFLVLVIFILAIGLVAMFSAGYVTSLNATGSSTTYIIRQLRAAAIGLAGMVVCMILPEKFYKKLAPVIFFGSIGLLVLVLIMGVAEGIAVRWLYLPVIGGFQPSEIAKLAIVIVLAALAERFGNKVGTIKNGIIFIAILGMYAGLIIAEKHISATIIVVAIGGVILFAAGTNIWVLLASCGAGAAGIALFILASPYALQRFLALDESAELTGERWQVENSLYAIGSGGMFGVGLFQSRQKFLYLPMPQNDFVFSILCEETGLIGAVLVIFIFVLLIICGFRIAFRAKTVFGTLVVCGIMTKLAVQVVLNMCVVTALIPPTGISLPFFSYGGTALAMQLAEMGIVLGVSRGRT